MQILPESEESDADQQCCWHIKIAAVQNDYLKVKWVSKLIVGGREKLRKLRKVLRSFSYIPLDCDSAIGR